MAKRAIYRRLSEFWDLSFGNLICGRPSAEANVFHSELWDWDVAGAVQRKIFWDLSLGNLICGRPSVEANVFHCELWDWDVAGAVLRKIFWDLSLGNLICGRPSAWELDLWQA